MSLVDASLPERVYASGDVLNLSRNVLVEELLAALLEP